MSPGVRNQSAHFTELLSQTERGREGRDNVYPTQRTIWMQHLGTDIVSVNRMFLPAKLALPVCEGDTASMCVWDKGRFGFKGS